MKFPDSCDAGTQTQSPFESTEVLHGARLAGVYLRTYRKHAQLLVDRMTREPGLLQTNKIKGWVPQCQGLGPVKSAKLPSGPSQAQSANRRT